MAVVHGDHQVFEDLQATRDEELKNSKFTDTFILMTAGVMLSWSALTAIISATEFAQDYSRLFIMCFVAMVAARIILANKYTLIIAASILGVAALFVLVNHINRGYEEYSIWMNWDYFLSNIILYINGLIPHDPAFEDAIIMAMVIGITLLVALFGYALFNFFLLFALGCLTFALLLTSGFFTFHLSFYVFIIASAVFLVKYLNQRNDEGMRVNSPFAMYALPLVIFCVFIAGVAPKPSAGFYAEMHERLILRPFNRANRFLYTTFRPAHFALHQTGFGGGDGRRLGGDMTLNENIFMRVRTADSIYLTGVVLDRYTGYSWVNSRPDAAPLDFTSFSHNLEWFERASSTLTAAIIGHHLRPSFSQGIRHLALMDALFDVDEFFAADYLEGILELTGRPEEVLRYNAIILALGDMQGDTFIERYLDYLRVTPETNEVEIDILDFRIFTTFYNGILSNITTDDFAPDFLRDPGGSITSAVRMPRHARYTVEMYELPARIDTRFILQNSRPGIFRDARAALPDIAAAGLDPLHFHFENSHMRVYYPLILDYLIDRADEIREVYTALPADFPERIRVLSEHLTADAANDYERARILESFLRTFPYTLQPGASPIDLDFVYHFLFYGQRGYCVHFASAFVVMARSIGLPARYIEGFNVVGFIDDDGFIYVANSLGHAWGEVYFEGFGWYAFEPTPGGGLIGVFANPAAPGFVGRGNWDDEFGYYDLDHWLDIVLPGPLNPVDPTAAAEYDYNGVSRETVGLGSVLLRSTAVVAGLLLLALCLRVFLIFMADRKVLKMDNNGAAVFYFHKMVGLCDLFDGAIRMNETAMQFGRRVAGRFGFDSVSMEGVAEIFNRARYSGREISKEDRDVLRKATEHLEARGQKQAGPYSYFVHKYFSFKK